ncbi:MULTISPECIES: SURF1 family protein [unclassified Luteococcus]|uniref:SURF1 family protein n=1 Tax=unclassified Luteococcus TaxID=2639923 RepID=UPI00313A8101
MTKIKQLLVALLGGALTLFMVFLGLWQMQVFQSQADGSAAQRAAAPAVDLEQSLTGGKVGDLYGRQVTTTGQYLPGKQVLAGTEYPLQVVSAFRTNQGHTVAVVRGTVGQGQAVPAAPAGAQQVTGLILPTQSRGTQPVPAGAPAGTLASVRLEQLAQLWPAPMLDGFITQPGEPARAQGLGEAVPVIPDVGGGTTRNRGYALQWWAFAAFGAVATAAGVRAVGRSADAG